MDPLVVSRESAPIATRQSDRWIAGWTVWLGGQAALFAWQSVREWQGFRLGHDFAVYWQAIWWLGTHGTWFPPDSVLGFPALANNGEWILLIFGKILYPLWPHPTLLLMVQDAALVAASAMAWRWIVALSRGVPARRRMVLAGSAMLALTANLWMLRTDVSSWHPECLAAVFLLGAARAVSEHRNRAAAGWVLGLLSCGTIGAVLVVGLAGSAWLQRRWGVGAVLGAVGVAGLVCLSVLHWNQGSVLVQSYSYLWAPTRIPHASALTVAKAAVVHPGRVLQALGGNAPDAVLNLLPSAFVGVASSLVAGPVGLWLLINNLVQPHLVTQFSAPGFQFAPIYAMLTVGVFDRVQRGFRSPSAWRFRGAMLLVVIVTCSTLGLDLALFSLSQAAPPKAQAQMLTQVLRHTPPTQAVIASQSVVGRFSSRPWVYAVMRTTHFPLSTPETAVVIVPHFGNPLLPTRDQEAEVRDLLHNPRARLCAHREGVWWFVVRRTPAHPTLALPYPAHAFH